jgi:hypothetical protein
MPHRRQQQVIVRSLAGVVGIVQAGGQFGAEVGQLGFQHPRFGQAGRPRQPPGVEQHAGDADQVDKSASAYR